ncbi:MAG TPA: hypothetical protein VL490_09330 [Mucilaginibacter sp.]|jgi:hypothetical protein|nr:hypothetical protein [Mucilaginibacter sp.]
MDILTSFLLSQSILIPILIGTFRIKRLDRTNYPFFIVLLVGLLAEVASFIFIDDLKLSNAPVINVYHLLECCLILYQLYIWKNSAKSKSLFMALGGICVTFWFIEIIVFKNINSFSPYFSVFYSFVLILLSINQINAMMFYHEEALFKNPRFIISLGFIIIFLYQIIYEASCFVGNDQSVVTNKIIIGWGYINLGINILYTIAFFFVTGKNEDEYNHYFKR